MGRKLRNFLRGVAVLIAVIAVLLEMGIVEILNVGQAQSFWILLISFGVILIASRA
jgi:hypothetical protein